MKAHILALLQHAAAHRLSAGALSHVSLGDVPLERTRDPAHGDFSSSLALSLAKAARCKPRDLAMDIVAALPPSAWVTKVEVAGPGFINFFLAPAAYHGLVADILAKADTFGHSTLGRGQRVQVEFVSANPTGPLHVGHGRGAAFGATLANVLEAAGYQVQREYYVNDAGRQMDILATSLWLRYLSRAGAPIPFPSNGYRGQYIIDMADDLFTTHGVALVVPADAVLSGLPPDETTTPDGTVGDKEAHIDALIGKAKTLLGSDRYRTVFDQALNTILSDIRADLAAFAVTYDEWYSERVLTETFAIEQVLNTLDAGGHLYTQDGAVWFRSTAFGDEKDRVVRRENGQTTYFASDIAYHAEKFARGFDRVIDVWGADHHGYIPRVQAALQALGLPAERLQVLLVQFAILYRQGERAQMSTRSGEFVTLRDLCREVGNDAARFFYVMRKSEQHMDFDLDLATSQSKDNPVYYIQYAHARVCSVLRQLAEKGLSFDPARGLQQLHLLTQPHEQALMVALSRYPEVLEAAAVACEPHQLAHSLRDIANAFHTCYNEHRVLVPEDALRDARLTLGVATRQVLRNGLRLLGVSAPEVM